jgi:hypothetical protein
VITGDILEYLTMRIHGTTTDMQRLISRAPHPNSHHEKRKDVKPAQNRTAYLDLNVCVVNQASFLLNYCVPSDQIYIYLHGP